MNLIISKLVYWSLWIWIENHLKELFLPIYHSIYYHAIYQYCSIYQVVSTYILISEIIVISNDNFLKTWWMSNNHRGLNSRWLYNIPKIQHRVWNLYNNLHIIANDLDYGWVVIFSNKTCMPIDIPWCILQL